MGSQEEPEHQRFDGVCRDCGIEMRYSSGVKRHPDHVRCQTCEEIWIAGRLTNQEIYTGPVTGQG